MNPKKQRVPSISDAEWIVMREVWTRGAMTTNQVVDALETKAHWKPKTVQTLLARLARKGALTFEKRGREYLFRPRVTAAQCEHAITESFLGRFFGGELAPFLSRFVERERLSAREIRDLKKILDRSKP
jgi:BlaI family penicillinase repressor